jgi:hypothetical protein
VISYERFRAALTNIEGSQWRLFERLAQTFLTDEYPSLRPMASPSGDEGKDAVLFVADDEEDVVLQFSVRKDWSRKVIETCQRLRKTTPHARVLIYATNQDIGPQSSETRRIARKEYKLHLDIRDREWFLTNRNSSAMTTAEAEEFCRATADPYLSGDDAIQRQAQALSDLEAKAAFVYLGLQWADDNRDKGLTKLCFEAIVRSVLRETTSERRITRNEIHAQVGKLLPSHPSGQLQSFTDAALKRLDKVHLRHWRKLDEFCLTHQERVRLSTRLADVERMDDALRSELRALIVLTAEERGDELTEVDEVAAVERTRSVIERILLDRGQTFAAAVARDRGAQIRFEDIEAVVSREITVAKGFSLDARLVSAVVSQLFMSPPEETRSYLRSLADTYTLFAFMKETPDVQSAVVKMFSDGDIWLDTSVILPLLAEELLDETSRSHTHLLAAVQESGLRLHVTGGVVEELETHINRCLAWYRSIGQGRPNYGEPPFLFSTFKLSGRSLDEFPNWLETFRGNRRPVEDVMDYLENVQGIDTASLNNEMNEAPLDLRSAVAEVWQEAREVREKKKEALGIPRMDSERRNRLVSHDVENYVGLVRRREKRGERRSPFGYKSWWLTLDRIAFRMHQELVDRIDSKPPASPAISPDFMLNYLAIGPVRARLRKRTEESLPLMLNMSVLEAVPQDLLDLADTLRKELEGSPPHVVDRKIRDTLDDARMLLGPTAIAGEVGLTEDVKARLIHQARKR